MQNFSDISAFIAELGLKGLVIGLLVLILAFWIKSKSFWSIGLYLTGGACILTLFGGLGCSVLVVEIPVMVGLGRLGAWRFKPAAPVTPPTRRSWGGVIFLGITLILALPLIAGSVGYSFPGSVLMDPYVFQVGQWFCNPLTHAADQVINMGYAIVLGIWFGMVLITLMWKK